jgi:hypothetical protein
MVVLVVLLVEVVVVVVVVVAPKMVVVVGPMLWTRMVPGSDMAPGPGSLKIEFANPSAVGGMQNTEASVVFAGIPGVMGPAGEPFSVMVRHVLLPAPLKQPTACAVWPGRRCRSAR